MPYSRCEPCHRRQNNDGKKDKRGGSSNKKERRRSASSGDISATKRRDDNRAQHRRDVHKRRFSAEVSKIVKEFSHDSSVFDPTLECRIPRFDRSELDLGRTLGKGGFSVVREVSSVRFDKFACEDIDHFRGLVRRNSAKRNSFTTVETFDFLDDELLDWEDEHMHKQVRDRNSIARRSVSKGANGRGQYVIKMVDPELAVSSPQRFCDGVVDLAIETRFLAAVRHPNIIRMRAMSLGDPYVDGHFIVLDRLYETLVDKLDHWTTTAKRTGHKGGINISASSLFRCGGGGGSAKRKDDPLIERLAVAYRIASAMKYLHGINVIYRDLKPDNVGFDSKGQVKIFDFGMAKEVYRKDILNNGTYELSGATGSKYYMAPEVALCRPYNEKVDSYSFAILLWQMCALEAPFAKFDARTLRSEVTEKGCRPKISRSWPKDVKVLLKKGWDSDFSLRPSFQEISLTLRDVLGWTKQVNLN